MATLIKFENVGKIYKTGSITYEALHDVNLEIEEGELVVILGPSGAGKSTLLNLLGGLDAATSGKIFFSTEELTGFNDAKLSKPDQKREYKRIMLQGLAECLID